MLRDNMVDRIIVGGYFNPHNKNLSDSFKESYDIKVDNGIQFSESILLSQIKKRELNVFRKYHSVYDFLKSNRNMAYTIREISNKTRLSLESVKEALECLLSNNNTLAYIKCSEVTLETNSELPDVLRKYYTVKFYYYEKPNVKIVNTNSGKYVVTRDDINGGLSIEKKRKLRKLRVLKKKNRK